MLMEKVNRVDTHRERNTERSRRMCAFTDQRCRCVCGLERELKVKEKVSRAK